MMAAVGSIGIDTPAPVKFVVEVFTTAASGVGPPIAILVQSLVIVSSRK